VPSPTVCRALLGLSLLASNSLLAAGWSSLQPYDNSTAAPIASVRLSTQDWGWWSLSEDSERPLTRMLLRRGLDGREASLRRALTRWTPGERIVALADGGVALLESLGSGGPVTFLQLRAADGSLRYSRLLDGRCGDPVSSGEELVVACGGSMYRLDGEGRLLQSTRPFIRGFGESRQWSLSDGRTVLATDTGMLSLALVNRTGAVLWRQSFSQGASEIYVDEQLAVVRFDGDSSSAFMGVALDSGAGAGSAQIDDAGPATLWRGQLLVAQTSPEGEGRLLSYDGMLALADARELGPNWRTDRLALSRDQEPALLIGGSENGQLAIQSLADPDPETELSRLPLAGATVLRDLQGLPDGGFVAVAATTNDATTPSRIWQWQGPEGELLSFDQLPAASLQPGQIDPAAGQLWTGRHWQDAAAGEVALQIDRVDFDSLRTVASVSRAPGAQGDTALSLPVIGSERVCVVHHPLHDPVLSPGTSSSTSVLLFCAPRGSGAPELPIPISLFGRSDVLALGVDELDRSVLLSLWQPGFGLSKLMRTTASGPTDVMTIPGATLSDTAPAPIALGPNLSGLIGDQFIDATGASLGRVGRVQEQPTAAQLLGNGDLLLTLESSGTEHAKVAVARVRADGQMVWYTRLDQAPALIRGAPYRYKLLAGAGQTLIESQDGGRTVLIDVNSGEIQSINETSRPQLGSQSHLHDLADAAGRPALWRLRNAGYGILAERLTPAGSVRHWLPCGDHGCVLLSSAVSAEGELLAQMFSEQQGQYQLWLGRAELDGEGQIGAASEPGAGLWRIEGDPALALVVGISPLDGRPRRFLAERQIDWVGGGQPRWSQLDQPQRQRDQLHYPLNMPRPWLRAPLPDAVGTIELNLNQLSLYPLHDAEGPSWLATRSAGSEQWDPYQFDQFSLGRLAADPRSSNVRLYFAAEDHWIAVDLDSGQGIWGRPDGSWLALQRVSGDDWQILDASPGHRLDPDAPPVQIAAGRLRSNDCRSLEWRVSRSDPEHRRRLAGDLQPREFRAHGCR
jgi:outer membrane protein assembly factor BamB